MLSFSTRAELAIEPVAGSVSRPGIRESDCVVADMISVYFYIQHSSTRLTLEHKKNKKDRKAIVAKCWKAAE